MTKKLHTALKTLVLLFILTIVNNVANAQQTFTFSPYTVTLTIKPTGIYAQNGLAGSCSSDLAQFGVKFDWALKVVDASGNDASGQIQQSEIEFGTKFTTVGNGNFITGLNSNGNAQTQANGTATAGQWCPASLNNFQVTCYRINLKIFINNNVYQINKTDGCWPVASPDRTFTTAAAGNFSSASTWSYVESGNTFTDIAPSSNGNNNITIKHKVTQDINFVIPSGKTLTLAPNAATDTFSIAPAKTLTVNGTANFGANRVTIKSDTTGTGRIGKSTGTITATNLTVERFIPYKAIRKFSFISSPVQQTVRNGWQQQVFITGAGTGGTPCGTTTGNGVASTDKYNSNGFDDTQNDPATMYTYNNTAVNGSRWVPISNTTSTSVVPGVGYRVNVRGDRNFDATTCQTQINYYGASPAATKVVLKATGTYSSTASRTLNASTQTLVGNPFPCELSFAALKAANNSVISNKIWIYPSNADNFNDQYCTWNAGTLVGNGFPTGYTIGSTDIILPSGGAFFVENATAGVGGTLQFNESTKSDSLRSGNPILSRTADAAWTDFARIHIAKQDGGVATEFDNIVVRFSDDASVDNITYGSLDAYSFNSTTSSISSFKGAARMAIQTRKLDFINDTVNLAVGSPVGTYRITVDEFENFSKAGSIYLIDKYMNTVTNLKVTPAYNFEITNDALSQGNERFAIVFKAASTLPVNFVSITAARKSSKVEVNFTIAKEVNVKDYTLERSTNGTTFSSTSTVVNAENKAAYTVLDNNALSIATFYRIKATDNDGKLTFSNIAKVDKTTGAVQFTLYPNPVVNELHINLFQAASNTAYTVNVLAANGSKVAQKTGNTQEATINMATAKLAPGVYVAQLVLANGDTYTQKFVKQ